LATTRLLFSYDFAPSPVFSLGVRAGFAFRGGPPAGMTTGDAPPVEGIETVPAHTPGSGGTPFRPFHFELRGNYWFAPLTNPRWRGYLGAGFGVAQVDAKVVHPVTDCHDVAAAAAASDPNDPDGANAYAMCISIGHETVGAPTTVLDAWKKVGRGFAALHAGGTVTLVGDLSVEVDVNLMYMFPTYGLVVEPSLGLVMGL
jgi:hypothetical protein